MSKYDAASKRQVEYLRILGREGFLTERDYANSREFRRKGSMSKHRADTLIKLGCSRRQRGRRN